MNLIASLLLAVLVAVPADAGSAFTSKKSLRRGGPRGLSLRQGAPGLNFSRGISNVHAGREAAGGLQSSQAGTPEASGGSLLTSSIGYGLHSNAGAFPKSSSSNGTGGSAISALTLKSATGTAQNSLTPEAADADLSNCRGADWVDVQCSVPNQPATIPPLTAAELAQCEAQAAAAPFYAGAQCNPASWWLQNHFYQPGGEFDTANNACRERVQQTWRTRRTYDNCPENYGSNQRRLIEGPEGSITTHSFRTQPADAHPENHVNEFTWAIRPILAPRNVDVWLSAEPGGEAVGDKACRMHDVYIFGGAIHYLIVDPAHPLPPAHQAQVDAGMYCVLKPGKTYYFNFKIERCEGAVCGVVSELYLH